MDDFEMTTENTIENEATNDYEETVETSSGSGLVGALIGGTVVALGAAVWITERCKRT